MSLELLEVSFFIYTANEGFCMFLYQMVTVKQNPHLLWASHSSTVLFAHLWPPFSVFTHNTDHHSHVFAVIALQRTLRLECWHLPALFSKAPMNPVADNKLRD